MQSARNCLQMAVYELDHTKHLIWVRLPRKFLSDKDEHWEKVIEGYGIHVFVKKYNNPRIVNAREEWL